MEERDNADDIIRGYQDDIDALYSRARLGFEPPARDPGPAGDEKEAALPEARQRIASIAREIVTGWIGSVGRLEGPPPKTAIPEIEPTRADADALRRELEVVRAARRLDEQAAAAERRRREAEISDLRNALQSFRDDSAVSPRPTRMPPADGPDRLSGEWGEIQKEFAHLLAEVREAAEPGRSARAHDEPPSLQARGGAPEEDKQRDPAPGPGRGETPALRPVRPLTSLPLGDEFDLMKRFCEGQDS